MPRRPLSDYQGRHFDVAVIGAGATGCATARKLAKDGRSVILLDRGDIGAGTSSRSSRLAYCGFANLKPPYPLWQIILRPVDMARRIYRARMMMQARSEFVRMMPHRHIRRTFYMPYRTGDRYPWYLMDLAFRFLSILGTRAVPLNYKTLSIDDARRMGGLAAFFGDTVRRVGVFDEYTYDWPERICVDAALEAEDCGAWVRTYTEVADVRPIENGWRLRLQDRSPEPHEPATITASSVVNAAGPWVDRVKAKTGQSTPHIIGVKGVNLMVRLPAAFRHQGIQTLSRDDHPFYVIPWGDLHFIGPTEQVVHDDPDTIKVEEADVSYLLSEANHVVPDLHLTVGDVLYSWCGVRPTSTDDGRMPAVGLRVRATDDHRGFYTVTGVPILFMNHAARRVSATLARRLGKARPAPTVGPARTYTPEDGIGQTARLEHVVHLDDLLRRRLPDGHDPSLGRSRLVEISRIAAAALNWSESRRRAECQRFCEMTNDIFEPSTRACACGD